MQPTQWLDFTPPRSASRRRFIGLLCHRRTHAFACGRRFRILAVVDDFSRECLALVADTSLSGARVARELTALLAHRGRPLLVVSDNGTELTSSAILRWSQERKVEWHYIGPESRPRTPSSRASTGASGMNA